ncbi:MAG: pantoate--beta-alanine ligase [Rhodospirillales bacterium]|nr:pantoate--beta-alanine ligase [Rhodospirillales bacterium]
MDWLMRTVRTVNDLRQMTDAWRREGATVALVPTMGALHAGHLALVALARSRADRVVASLFVNPRQFAEGEDLDRYPRDEASDTTLFREAGLDLLYAPDAAAMYAEGFATQISMAGPAEGLEADHRHGFFTGVATVVAKLLIQAEADIAVFGQKDYQQLIVVTQLARDLDLRTQIVGVETVREADGLAMSSRNAYLSDEDRARAPALHATLIETAAAVRAGTPVDVALSAGRQTLEGNFDRVDYLTLRDAATLTPLESGDGAGRLLAAVRLNTTRLIDNVAVDREK